MPTKREREYYRMGFKDGVESERYRVRDPGGQTRYEEPILVPDYEGPRVGGPQGPPIQYRKSKRKLSAWNKFVKANSKKPRFVLRSGKLNLKKMGVAFRKTPLGKKKKRR